MADERSFDEVLVALWEQGVTRREAVRRISLGVGVLGTAGWLAACGSDEMILWKGIIITFMFHITGPFSGSRPVATTKPKSVGITS